MQRRELVMMSVLGMPLANSLAQPQISVAQREVARRTSAREYELREWLSTTGFAKFFGDTKGPYLRVDNQPRTGRELVSAQAVQAFEVPFDVVELPTGHIVIGAHRKGYAPERCYAVLQGWSEQILLVGLLHFNGGRSKAERTAEFEAAIAASAPLKAATQPRLPKLPNEVDAIPTLTLFTRAAQPVQESLGRPLARLVRDQLRADIASDEQMKQKVMASGKTYSAGAKRITAFKTEHREIAG